MMSSGSQTPTSRVTACSRCRWAGPEQPEVQRCFAAHGVQPHPRQYTVVVSGQGPPPEFPVARCPSRRRSPFRRRSCRRAVGTDVVAGSERKPVPTGATGRDRCSAASMMSGCASRTVGRWRTPLQVIPRTQWAKGARHPTHLAYLVRLVTPAARTTQWRERLIPVTAIAPPPSPRSSSGSHPKR
jgi:hypothetical protein